VSGGQAWCGGGTYTAFSLSQTQVRLSL